VSGHTPGPWAVTKAKPRKVTAGGVVICNAVIRNMATTAQNKHGKSIDEAQANARLIASAPELLEAGERLTEEAKVGNGVSASALNQMLAAIAKAKGGAA